MRQDGVEQNRRRAKARTLYASLVCANMLGTACEAKQRACTSQPRMAWDQQLLEYGSRTCDRAMLSAREIERSACEPMLAVLSLCCFRSALSYADDRELLKAATGTHVRACF